MAPPANTPKAHEHAATRDWPGYFAAVSGKAPRDTLLKALDLFTRAAEVPSHPPLPRIAIDLGCGSGRDTTALLAHGWKVLAIDSSPLGLDLVRQSVPEHLRPNLETRLAPFEGLTLPSATLINASYALPFCNPAAFPALWHAITAAIPVGGRFCGQLFGERDGWATLPDRTHHTRRQVNDLFQNFNLEDLKEIENREAGVTGEVKDWHIFHIVAKRRL